ncbi:unnamed protein product [Boreogadus saida]
MWFRRKTLSLTTLSRRLRRPSVGPPSSTPTHTGRRTSVGRYKHDAALPGGDSCQRSDPRPCQVAVPEGRPTADGTPAAPPANPRSGPDCSRLSSIQITRNSAATGKGGLI